MHDYELDEKAISIIEDNFALEERIEEEFEGLPTNRRAMVVSSLLIQYAYRMKMSKDELLFIIGDMYDVMSGGVVKDGV